jgi:hypothetical protein
MPPGPELLRSVHTADGGVVLDIHRGKMFSLNATGSFIFRLLEQGSSEEHIVEELVERFDVPSDLAKADLAQFCESLKGHTLLAGRDAPASD